ncbi:MAG: hypothetical protein KGI27_10915 [Thaumarchaeota archaeon]|nr:hypothetical protein [Nitrososphaerota archaeon]
MKTLHLSLIIIVVFFLFLNLGQAHAYDDMYVQNIKVQPTTILVGDNFTVTATLVNYSPSTIFVEHGVCEAPFSTSFDNHVHINENNITCTTDMKLEKIDSGAHITAVSPYIDLVYNAAEIGNTNATITFRYDIWNQTSQSNVEKTVSKSFQFMIYNHDTGIPSLNYVNHPVITQIDSPLKQFKSGIKAEDVKCADGFTLVIKRENGLPACITPDDLPKLVLRGWSVNPISHLLDKGYSTQEQQDRFFYDIMNLAPLKNWSESGWEFVGGNSIDVGKVHFSQLQLYLPPNSGSPKISCDKGWHADIAIDTRMLTVINATYPLAGDCANQTSYIYREMALEPKGPNESVPSVIPTPSNVMDVENSNFTISYDITGGMLDSAKYDNTRAALEIYLTANGNGDLVVTIPRQLLDSPQHIEPYQFFVMVDNYPVRYVQTTSASNNTLTIPFSSGSAIIEISVSE